VSDERSETTADGPRAAEAPDTTAVNASWRAEGRAPDGVSGVLARLLDRVLGTRFEAQRAFNAHQVQLDNALVEHLEKRFAGTHEHYDRILGDLGRRLDEADARHARLEEELVTHVRDLVRRIDLVLAEAHRGGAAVRHDLEDLRAHLTRVEAALSRSE
jgi:hypothetical protein